VWNAFMAHNMKEGKQTEENHFFGIFNAIIDNDGCGIHKTNRSANGNYY